MTMVTITRRGSGSQRTRLLIAGLGNLLLRDDGVGVHAVRELQKVVPRRVRTVEVGTAVLDALHLFERADRILAIDAMEAGGPPGTLYRLEGGDVEEGGLQASLHQMGLLAVLRFLGRHRPVITVLGVQPELIDYGMDLSPSVQAALPRLVAAAKEIVTGWISAGGGGRVAPV